MLNWGFFAPEEENGFGRLNVAIRSRDKKKKEKKWRLHSPAVNGLVPIGVDGDLHSQEYFPFVGFSSPAVAFVLWGTNEVFPFWNKTRGGGTETTATSICK